MPLWKIYHPVNAFSVEDKDALAEKITDVYARVMPRFYVNILFTPVPEDCFYIGGKRRNNFVRIVMEHIAREFPNEEASTRFINKINQVIAPYVMDRDSTGSFTSTRRHSRCGACRATSRRRVGRTTRSAGWPRTRRRRAHTTEPLNRAGSCTTKDGTMMESRDNAGMAVVTGASSGIGAAYADRLAARGHALLLVARRKDRLDAAAQQLSARHGVRVETLVADLQRRDDLAVLEQRLAQSPVSVLVNNAGAGVLGPTARSTADAMEGLIRLNIVALTRLSHAALTGFRTRGAGTLVNLGSIIALAPNPGGAVYSGTKAYVLNFTQSLQMEHKGTAIRIQVVMPGPIRTEFFTSQGLTDAIFPDKSFITAEQLVDAAIAGLDAGELVTSPTLTSVETWSAVEDARRQYLAETTAGQVAARYRSGQP